MEKPFDLGSIETGGHVLVNKWLYNISRYKSVRFWGYCIGRVFIGIVAGAKGQSELEQAHESYRKVWDELQQIKRENEYLKKNNNA